MKQELKKGIFVSLWAPTHREMENRESNARGFTRWKNESKDEDGLPCIVSYVTLSIGNDKSGRIGSDEEE